MPLIILGLILIAGIVIYWLLSNSNLEDGRIDTSPIREQYSDAVKDKADKAGNAAKNVKDELTKKIRKRAGIYDVDYDIEDDGYGKRESDTRADTDSGTNDTGTKDNSIPFPRDVEREKRKRDIH